MSKPQIPYPPQPHQVQKGMKGGSTRLILALSIRTDILVLQPAAAQVGRISFPLWITIAILDLAFVQIYSGNQMGIYCTEQMQNMQQRFSD